MYSVASLDLGVRAVGRAGVDTRHADYGELVD